MLMEFGNEVLEKISVYEREEVEEEKTEKCL
jgi:hypothetical protein